MSDLAFWTLTTLLGIGTFLIRFSFLGFWGGRKMPDWMILHLKYVGVGVFPALVTPLVVWPDANDGEMDPVRIVAIVVALGAGLRFGVIWAITSGMGVFYCLRAILNLL